MRVLFFDVKLQITPDDSLFPIEQTPVALVSCAFLDTEKSPNIVFTDILREGEIRNFHTYIQRSTALVGWDTLKIGSKILSKYLPPGAIEGKRHVDLKALIEEVTGQTTTLKDAAESLGIPRLGDNKDATTYFRRGYWFEFTRLALMDINVILRLFTRSIVAGEGENLLVKNQANEQIKLDLFGLRAKIEERIKNGGLSDS